jgi:hypothetical protein
VSVGSDLSPNRAAMVPWDAEGRATAEDDAMVRTCKMAFKSAPHRGRIHLYA